MLKNYIQKNSNFILKSIIKLYTYITNLCYKTIHKKNIKNRIKKRFCI